MANVKIIDRQPSVAKTNTSSLLKIAFSGAVVGLSVWLGSYLIRAVLFERVFCQASDNVNICVNSVASSYNIALIFASAVGLFLLIKVWANRPLLIVATALISMWGYGVIFNSMPGYMSLPLMILLFGLAYLLFAWIGKISNLAIVLVVSLVAIVALRLIA